MVGANWLGVEIALVVDNVVACVSFGCLLEVVVVVVPNKDAVVFDGLKPNVTWDGAEEFAFVFCWLVVLNENPELIELGRVNDCVALAVVVLVVVEEAALNPPKKVSAPPRDGVWARLKGVIVACVDADGVAEAYNNNLK